MRSQGTLLGHPRSRRGNRRACGHPEARPAGSGVGAGQPHRRRVSPDDPQGHRYRVGRYRRTGCPRRTLGEPSTVIALLDTHVLIWWLTDSARLSPAQRNAVASASPSSPPLVSGISLWEVATLHSLGRVRLAVPLRDWLEAAVAPPLVRVHGVSPAIAAELGALPDSFHRDPADRILVATARVLGATLLTQNRRIIEAGLANTLS
ncbi:MAG: type II toxin-antitoxin system VapC family toxin [Acidobacteria bacterium]|nr:type II toxin-antitoxin system VapC family toxin [Acidobacteriota bacterium]